MDSEYPTAPEVPRKVPQLVRDGKQLEPEELEPAAEAPDEEPVEEPDELNEYVENPGDPDGVVAAEEEKKWRDGYQVTTPKPKKHRWPIVLLIMLLVAGAAFAAYKYGTKKASAPAKKAPASQTSTVPKQEKIAAVPTKHYDSTIYTLGFDYPETWTVSDTDSKLTVTSPSIQLTGTNGSAAGAHVVVTIQNPQKTIPGYPSAGAVAALTSDKLTYKQPTAVQRAQTYLSYLGYKATGLDALYITGDNGYQQGQTVPMSDIVKGNPLVSITFVTCSTVGCSNTTPTSVTLSADGWKSSNASKQVIGLLQSMQVN
jgi:hypothetical protein